MTPISSSGFGRSLRRTSVLSAIFVFCLGAIAAFALPSHIIISAPAGAAGAATLAEELAIWRQTGLVADALQLDSRNTEGAEFAQLVVLEFPDEPSCLRWQQVAQPKLGAGLIATRVDSVVRNEKTPRNSANSVFVVNTYDMTTPVAKYNDYVKAYIVPQMEGLKATREIMMYQMFTARPGSGVKWSSLLVKEYRNIHTFEMRDQTKNTVRQKLANNPAWNAFHKIKASLRKDLLETHCYYVEPVAPDLSDLPEYKVEFNCVGGLRIHGSELKNSVEMLATAFKWYHPDLVTSTSHITSSEGCLAGLYMGTADVAPSGDDAKITDIMAFYNTFRYNPLEIRVSTGGFEKRGSLFAWAIAVNKDNPIEKISLEELECVFGAERTGGWEIADNDYKYTSKFARSADTNIRKWNQLGLSGEFNGKEIQTYGYVSPGFAISIERNLFHWSKKWNPNFKEYVEAKQTSPDEFGAKVASERMMEALSNDKFGIAICARMHAKLYPNVKIIAVSKTKNSPAIVLNPENVSNRTYPLVRDGYFYVNRAPGRPLDPKVREFMRFVLSRQGQEIMAQAGYYYPLNAEFLKEQLKKLD
ncbi:MAG: hypothetical protein PHQ04_09130 [Opitutaceae bacterium]|nr:hypothetical protein [Opitutaceae bacterium]